MYHVMCIICETGVGINYEFMRQKNAQGDTNTSIMDSIYVTIYEKDGINYIIYINCRFKH